MESEGRNAWETFDRSWEQIREDDHGSLAATVASYALLKKRQRLNRDVKAIQRGIIRHLYIISDVSRAMSETDLKPNRIECAIATTESFITEFFDQNPISQVGVIMTKDGVAEKVSELGGNPTDHIAAIKKREMRETSGEPSLQNALTLACDSLCHVPTHGSREILVIWASLTTCDPGNIFETLDRLKKENIRVSIISLSAEVKICKQIANDTKGSYGVVLNESHFKDLLFENLSPPAIQSSKNFTNMIQMGFPESTEFEDPVLCVCHTEKPSRKGYTCPRCTSFICTIPTDCPVCSLTLVSAPLLARSFHHLFPLQNFVEVEGRDGGGICFGCRQSFGAGVGVVSGGNGTIGVNGNVGAVNGGNSGGNGVGVGEGSERFECPECKHLFCFECDLFVHDVLHNCPGCLNDGK